jgi:hypothetical protein
MVLDGTGCPADKFKVAPYIHHAPDRQRYEHRFEEINKVFAVPLHLASQVNPLDTIIQEHLDIPCKQAGLV